MQDPYRILKISSYYRPVNEPNSYEIQNYWWNNVLILKQLK